MIHCHDVLFSAMRHTKSSSLADLLLVTYPHFAQPPGETSHDDTLCFLTAARRSRRLGTRGSTPLREAAQNGHAAVVDQLISAGAMERGRGPGRVSGCFGVALTR